MCKHKEGYIKYFSVSVFVTQNVGDFKGWKGLLLFVIVDVCMFGKADIVDFFFVFGRCMHGFMLNIK